MSGGSADQTLHVAAAHPKKKKDPRSKDRQVLYDESRKVQWNAEESQFEIYCLLVMLLSITGVWMDWKYCVWLALILSLINIGNIRPVNEAKQIISSIFVSIASIYVVYLKNSTPVGDYFSAGA